MPATPNQLLVNAEQFKALTTVGRRVMVELQELAGVTAPMAAATSSVEEPLRWLIHGGPGTGKSHVLKQIRELFTDVLHWDIGVQYQIVAFQAVMAEQLGGDTIHHACGIPVFQRGDAAENGGQRQMDVAKRVMQWRWMTAHPQTRKRHKDVNRNLHAPTCQDAHQK